VSTTPSIQLLGVISAASFSVKTYVMYVCKKKLDTLSLLRYSPPQRLDCHGAQIFDKYSLGSLDVQILFTFGPCW